MSDLFVENSDRERSEAIFEFFFIGMHDDPNDSIFSKAIEEELERELAKEKAKNRVILWSNETYKRFFNNKDFLRGKK